MMSVVLPLYDSAEEAVSGCVSDIADCYDLKVETAVINLLDFFLCECF